MAQEIHIDELLAGRRADVVAAETLPKISRAYVQTLFDTNLITLNGKSTKPGYKLRAGDVLSIDFNETEHRQIPDIKLPVLYEDDDVIVINKPSGVISHSRGRYWYEPSVASFIRQKLINYSKPLYLDAAQGEREARTETYKGYDDGVLERSTQRSAKSDVSVSGSARKQDDTLQGFGGDRAGIVHRLDRATSGVMICAKNSQSLSWLQKQFSDRSVKKTYIAVIDGPIEPSEAVIDMPIERNPKAPATFRVGSNGKPAITKYKVLYAGKDGLQVIEMQPLTGRTHQLRVHLKELKHPIIGDTLYGDKESERLMLHAYSLEITLPSKERKVFKADLPEEFYKIVPGLRL